MLNKSRILITCPKGIPPFLKEELQRLAFPILREDVAGVETEGTLQQCMRLNLFVRTGHRVLFLIKSFSAQTPEKLYAETYKIPWEDYIPEEEYICITSAVWNDSIRDNRFANVRCKDAIVDRMRKKCGRRPDSGPETRNVVVFLYWQDEACSIYLDTSGEALSRRGYRKISLKAPMQETLAAAVIQATGWNGTSHFINPMCGSGTLAIEAALLGFNRAAGILRDNFAFMHLMGFYAEAWQKMRAEAKQAVYKSMAGRIIATDNDPEAIAAAKNNAQTAGVEHLIEFSVCDFADTPIPDGGGTVVLNPGYGERMGEIGELEKTYKDIGDFFKQKCLGLTGYVLTGNLELAKKIGLRASRHIPFFNSEIECRLLKYELYEGSRRQPTQ
jgi:putative N6-adenine-specific DNA methylase